MCLCRQASMKIGGEKNKSAQCEKIYVIFVEWIWVDEGYDEYYMIIY